jgi:tight adherence protein B
MAKKKQEPEFLPSPINNLMRNYAVYVPSAAENFLARLVMFILGGVTGLIFFSGLFKVEGEATMATHISDIVVFCLIGLVAMRFLAPVFFNRRHEKRDAQLRNQFRDLLDSLSASLSSGANPLEAFRSAYRRNLLSLLHRRIFYRLSTCFILLPEIFLIIFVIISQQSDFEKSLDNI